MSESKKNNRVSDEALVEEVRRWEHSRKRSVALYHFPIEKIYKALEDRGLVRGRDYSI